MKPLDFNKILDKYLTEGTMTSEEYELLDDEQKLIIQTIKRAFARLNKREILTTHHSLI
jgi:molybdopterin biosynthesis enzyme MoaB